MTFNIDPQVLENSKQDKEFRLKFFEITQENYTYTHNNIKNSQVTCHDSKGRLIAKVNYWDMLGDLESANSNFFCQLYNYRESKDIFNGELKVCL